MKNLFILFLVVEFSIVGIFADEAKNSSKRNVGSGIEICRWKNNAVSAVSITIDDNNAQDHVWWIKMGENYGFKFTWFIITGRINTNHPVFGSWDNFSTLQSKGHDIQSHTVSHLTNGNLTITSEYSDSKKIIEDTLKGTKVLSLAFPGGQGQEKNDPKEAAKYYLFARGVKGLVNIPGEIDLMNVNSISGCSYFFLEEKHWASFNGALNPKNKQKFGAWYCMHIHALKDQDKDNLIKIFEFLSQNKDKIWCAPFTEVASYELARTRSVINIIDNKQEQIILKIDGDPKFILPNLSLSLKVLIPKGKNIATIEQSGKKLDFSVYREDSCNFAIIDVVPGKSEISINFY